MAVRKNRTVSYLKNSGQKLPKYKAKSGLYKAETACKAPGNPPDLTAVTQYHLP